MDEPSVPSPSPLGVVPRRDAALQDLLAVAQFDALRAELIALRENMIKLGLWSIAGFPALTAFFGRWTDPHEQGTQADSSLELLLICASPIMVSLCAVLFCSLHCGVMRIGGFIRDEIEGKMMDSGWERHLEKPGRRMPERFFLAVMMIFYMVYFGVAVMLVYTSSPNLWFAPYFPFALYAVAFMFSVVACFLSFRFHPTNATDGGTAWVARIAKTVLLKAHMMASAPRTKPADQLQRQLRRA